MLRGLALTVGGLDQPYIAIYLRRQRKLEIRSLRWQLVNILSILAHNFLEHVFDSSHFIAQILR